MGANPSTVKFEASISGELHKLLERAAQFRGLSMADFVFDAAREAAKETLDAPELSGLKPRAFHLSPEDQNFVADLILNPPPISPAVEGALKRHKELVQSDCWD